jgi:protein-disulfide isomerase
MKKQKNRLNPFISLLKAVSTVAVFSLPALAEDSGNNKIKMDKGVETESNIPVHDKKPALNQPASVPPVNDEQFNKKIADFLKNNPKVIVESLQKFSEDQQLAQQQKMQASLASHQKEICANSQAAVLGKPDSPTKLVVFLDPNCPHCRHFEQAINKVRGNFPNVTILLRHWAIMGKDSEELAQGLWAIKMQGINKYDDISRTIAASDEPYTYAKLIAWATAQKLDIQQLEKDAKSDATGKIVAQTHSLAQELGLQGTPTSILIDKKGIRIVMPTDEKSLEAILKESSKA